MISSICSGFSPAVAIAFFAASDPGEEFRECQLKAKILVGIADSMFKNLDPVVSDTVRDSDFRKEHKEKVFLSDSQKNFGLFESILWSGSYLWLEEHLKRLAASAAVLGFSCDKAAAILMLSHLEEELCRFGGAPPSVQLPGTQNNGKPHQTCSRFKVKLSLSFKGTFSVGYEPIAVQRSAVQLSLCLAGHRTDSTNPLLCHKTTARELYDRYFTLARQKGYDDVLFLNERGEVSEGAISTIFIRKGRQLFTPPLQSGLLNGIYRSYLFSARPFVSERTITLDDLLTAETIFIANSVRGLRPAMFTGDQIFS